MKKHSRVRDVFLGALIATLLFSLASPAFAALTTMSIEAFTGVKVYVNDQLVDPRDANGNPVDVLVYNGTTYLPIRAVGNALGMAVQYDAATQSAYLGAHNSQIPAFYLDELDYFSGTKDSDFFTAAAMDDNLKQGHSRCITQDFERTYKLNGQYSRLTGNLFQEYDMRSDTIYKDGGIWIYADGALAYAKEFNENTTGFEPEAIDIDLRGVLELKVVFIDGSYMKGAYSNHGSHYGPLALGEMALYT